MEREVPLSKGEIEAAHLIGVGLKIAHVLKII